MSKDPAVLFYTSDFLAGTLTMTDAQKGRYITLLCLQHQQGFLTEEDMMSICKEYDPRVFSKFYKAEDGYYYNKRMKDESAKRKKHIEHQRDKAKKRWSGNAKADATADAAAYTTACATAMPLENENENRDNSSVSLKKKEKITYQELFEKVLRENDLVFSDEIKSLFLEWLKYKSEKGQAYKETGMKSLIIKTMNDCGGDPAVLRDMILYSTSKNYTGLFKGDNNNGIKRNTNGTIPATREGIERVIDKYFPLSKSAV